MRRALAAAVLLLAAAAPAASAAPFGELPFRPVSGVVNCLRATGLPGELSRWTPDGVELSTASAGGIVAHSTVFVRGMTECPVVASDPSGFAALAVATKDGVRIAVREPLAPQGTSVSLDSGVWGAQTTIPDKDAGNVHAAVSARGDVLVVWSHGAGPFSPGLRARAVLRAPGGPYGKPQRIGMARASMELAAGLSASGEAEVVLGVDDAIRVATARPGAAFGASNLIASGRDLDGRLALAVGADGRALLAGTVAGQIGVFERRPGAGFARLTTVPTEDPAADAAVAMAGDGTDAVAWRSAGGVSLIRRAAGAAFGAPIVLRGVEPPLALGVSEAELSFSLSAGGPLLDGPSGLHALLNPGGAALVTWGTDEGAGFAATVDPAGTADVEPVGSAIRDVTALTPLWLGDTTRAIAWSDNNPLTSASPIAGRMHLAVEGASATAAAPIPELTVGPPVDASLRPAQPLILPVRCSAACDIRALDPRRQHLFDPGLTLARAGSARLRIDHTGRPLAPAGPGTIKVKLRWSAPSAREVQERTVTVRVRRLPRPPFPRLLNVRARHSAGGVVDVRWSTDVPARDVSFIAYGTRGRRQQLDEDSSTGFAVGKGQRRLHLKLTAAARVRWVRLYVAEQVGGRHRIVLVRVT